MLRAALTLFCLSLAGCAGPVPKLSISAVMIRERNIKELIEEAIYRMDQGGPENFRRAQAALELASELNPRDARVLDGFGCLAWKIDAGDLAANYFDRAVAADSGYDLGYAHLAVVQIARGNYWRGRELLETALRLNPLNGFARQQYALLLDQVPQWRSGAVYERLKAQYSGGGGKKRRIGKR